MKLEGVKVVDLSLFLPGPHLTMMMADHGAEVIKVEPYDGGEPARNLGYRKAGESVWFRNTNRGKQSLRINLKTDAGRDLLLRLADESDVFIESFRPGVVDRLGVGYEAVRRRAPHVVYCSLSAFGQDGPYREKPAHDMAVEAMAGLVAANLGDDHRPTIPCVPAADMGSSLMALSGILMALLRRQATGQGDFIDIAMFDSILAWTCNVTGSVFAEGRAPVIKHQRTWGGNAFYQIYETADGRFVCLGGVEYKFADNLLTALGRPDLAPLCKEPPGPVQDPVKEFLRQQFKTRTQAQWVEWFDGRDVCFAPILDLKEAFDDPNVRQREMLLFDDDGTEHIGVPIKFKDEPAAPRFPVPGFGEHSGAIAKRLGYDDDEVEALFADRVIG